MACTSQRIHNIIHSSQCWRWSDIDSGVGGIGNGSLHYLWSDIVVVFYLVYRSSQVKAQGQGKQQFMVQCIVRFISEWENTKHRIMNNEITWPEINSFPINESYSIVLLFHYFVFHVLLLPCSTVFCLHWYIDSGNRTLCLRSSCYSFTPRLFLSCIYNSSIAWYRSAMNQSSNPKL